jgi:hypothetical protein
MQLPGQYEQTRAIAPRIQPRTAVLTPGQVRDIRSVTRSPSIILARFPATPGARPVLHVDDPLSLRPRVANSIEYIDWLISDYLLDPAHFPSHVAARDAVPPQLSVIFQVADAAADIPGTVGYCASGEKVTLIPDVHFAMRRAYLDHRQEFEKTWIPWSDRVPIVFWRGSSTGAATLTHQTLAGLPRFRLCSICANSISLRGLTDVKLSKVVQAQSEDERRRMRGRLTRLGLLAAPVPQTNFLRYKFQIDIDGNTNSWGLLLKLYMGACVLKIESQWRQWYYPSLRPWEHYVPIANDLSDLEERVAWCFDNEQRAGEIAENGMKFAHTLGFETEMRRAAERVFHVARSAVDGA